MKESNVKRRLISMKQSTILFIVALLVLVWFSAEAFPGQQICVTSCISLSGLNVAEQIAAVVALPIILVIAGVGLRRSGKDKNVSLGETETVNAPPSRENHDTDSSHSGSERASENKP
jgi:hypothetical protein